MSDNKGPRERGDPDEGGCLPRRDFIRSAALVSVAALTARNATAAEALGGESEDVKNPVPNEKRPAQSSSSLSDRGQATVYRGSDLSFIGMPISGITTGQLYLGGDGKLWYWDIFNQTKPTEQPGASHYTNPLLSAWFRAVDQGFSLRLSGAESTPSRPLSSDGFADVSFRGEYPIGYVSYRDSGCPVSIEFEAFSPFIPLNVDDSSLPATILRFTLTNTSTDAITGELTGLLENAVARSVDADFQVTRLNTIERDGDLLLLNCTATVATSMVFADGGAMGLALLAAEPTDTGIATVAERPEHSPAGTLTRPFSLASGASQVVIFAIVWLFPNLGIEWSMGGSPMERLAIKGDTRRHYATRFGSVGDVALYVARHRDRLYTETKLWHDTWYEASTLPHWLLERTLASVSTLATSAAFRFADGRFYGSESVGGGPGTPTHVWGYEQAMGRLFPELDVALRERTDFNPAISFHPDGRINVRGELPGWEPAAIDGQAMVVLRVLRDHQTSPDDSFLKRNWAAVKMATQWLIAQDGNGDGILEGEQPNTLDAAWYGPVAWLSGLYLAALRAAEEMALEAGDAEFAGTCRKLVEAGRKNLVDRLFSEGYFINQPDPKHPEAINSGTGCEIDQVLGQSWAFQVGLGRVLPENETRSALAALWRYNFMKDVGPYRGINKPGRWYAMPGEAGLLMCTFPRKDWDFDQAKGAGKGEFTAGYFNECMTGFEHQVAAHMIWEGMVEEGLAIERAVHERYHASRRNPWNEVEAGDHYARAMASYGVYVAVCRFEYHGPKGYIAFAPQLTPEDFKSAFTAALGWGTFTQNLRNGVQTATIDLKYGTLRLRTISLTTLQSLVPVKAVATLNEKRVAASMVLADGRARITLSRECMLEQHSRLTLELT